MRRKRLRQVMMPTLPSACFKMIHSNFPFAFFKSRFNRPTHPAQPHEGRRTASGWGIADVILRVCRLAQTPPHNDPDALAGQLILNPHQSQEGKVGLQWPSTAFFDSVAFPSRARQVFGYLPNLAGRGGRTRQAWIEPWTTQQATPGGTTRGRRTQNRVSPGTSARNHLPRAEIPCKNVGL